ncbi:MAG: hypothetical protein HN712_07215 [Gemmatimonadetes bacterium]|nr:hypothetical protein [Gemmatimonadota bacterium]MBT7860085.1 hypothetical protein [Gemmatimonadota bacterium]
MATPLADTLRSSFDDLLLGAPQFDPTANLPNMVVYPVFPARLAPDPPDVVSLTQGLQRGVRLSDTGIVTQVHVDNPLPTAILVGESDILVGPTQLRAVQFSCLVPPGRRASLPVNCVEAGQPTVYQAEFTDAKACPWFLRSFKLEQLARHGDNHQHRIWDRIKDYLKSTGTVSSTHDVCAVFDRFSEDVDDLSGIFPLHPGQVGCVSAVGQDLFIEIFGDPELLEERYDQVLHSALVEAIAHPTREIAPAAQIDGVLNELIEASRNSKVVHSRSLRDSGRTQVFNKGAITGSGLVSGGRLVHLTAHKRCWGTGRPFHDQLPGLEQDRSLRVDEQADLLAQLEDDYKKRRKRYRSFLRGLTPSRTTTQEPFVATDEEQEDDDDIAFEPMPLSGALHEFFLRLFRQ